MSYARIVLICLLVPLALFAQPAPDTLWTRVIWDAPGAQAQAVVQVDGGFVIASNRGQEVHLCMVDDSGTVVWSRWYGVELRGALNCNQIAARSDGCVLLTTMGDSNRVICTNSTGDILWRRSCIISNAYWDGNWEHQTSAIAPFLPGGLAYAARVHWYTHTGGNFYSTWIDGYDSICTWAGLTGGAPYNWYGRYLLVRDRWWAYVCGGDTSIHVRTPDFQQDYSVRWCARWLERAYGTPNPSGGLYLLGTMYSDSNAILGISAMGEVNWSQTVVTENGDFRDISAVPDSGCIVAGTLLSPAGGDRALLVRLGTRGEVLWVGEYGTYADEFITDAVFSTRSGGFVLAGEVTEGGTAYPYIICTRPDTAYWYAEITDFAATSCDSGVEIAFSAPIELNVDRYELLRSVSGPYRAVGTIPAGGTPVGHRQYRWIDHLAGGRLRYSLADISTDGLRREHPNLIASIDRVPTQIFDFKAREDSGHIQLTMRTAFEYGVDYYFIERRGGPTGTITLATVPSRGASYEGFKYAVEDSDYSRSSQYVYYPIAADSSGLEWPFTELADTILTQNPPTAPPVPLDYMLSAFPNPFNASTTLYFATSRTEKVRIDVYDIIGRFVTTVVNQEYAPGGWRVPFDAAGLPSGIYFARINTAAGFTATQKLLLLR